ncbi:MAG: threonine--tRNA ligase [Clostridia bacterium]|nr:threonine--tRNA ligase [Clostridia bacterium]
MMEILIKDGSKLQVADNASVLEIAKQISEGLARNAVAGKINGQMCQLSQKVNAGDMVEIVTLKDPEGMEVFRHSSAHVMALAVKRLYPDTKLSIGPAIKDGFYYDLDFAKPFGVDDLPKIEEEMSKIIKEKIPFERIEVSREEAEKIFTELNEPYKLELLQDIPAGELITIYKLGELTDLCRGPHLEDISIIKAFKLQNVTGAYWRGDEKNKMLSRVYGTSFPKKSELDDYLALIEEAKKRDHRKLGKELGLFFISEYAPGMPFYMPKGMVLKNELIKYWREIHKKANYVEIETPTSMSRELWEVSGHWGHYKQNMYTFKADEDKDYAVKPMNCPGCMIYYKENMHSYKDFPLRVGELGKVHRREASGTLHGLFRVRAFTQDDAHIFMLPSQIESEIANVLSLVEEAYKVFNLSYKLELSTMPEDHIGDIEDWEKVETSLKNALHNLNKEYTINEGDGAFYGPKIDIHIEDALGRTWQCGTIQLDMQLPKRFELTYIDADGSKKEPVMIHRVIYGSIDRFLGIMIENFAGAFPLWLAPVQVKIMNITDKHADYARNVKEQLEKAGIRAEFDDRNEKVGYKIREAQLEKVPYMLVLGDDEMAENKIAVRHRKLGDLGKMDLADFIANLKNEIETKEIK